jgi:hypothetical protein
LHQCEHAARLSGVRKAKKNGVRVRFSKKTGSEYVFQEAEDDEDHHLYHTKGWCRELWIQTLEMQAVLPPPEEVKQVETAIGAARAEQAREDML